MDICSDKNGTYYLASRDFEFEELQLLADAVACSKFISEEKSRALIGKIAHLTSNFRANELQRSVCLLYTSPPLFRGEARVVAIFEG